jgi:hypothetical protein
MRKHALVVEGAFILLLGFIFGVSLKKRPVIVPGPSPAEKKLDEKTAAALQQSQVRHDAEVAAATEEHTVAIDALFEEEAKATPALLASGQATNEYLKAVGQEVLGKVAQKK